MDLNLHIPVNYNTITERIAIYPYQSFLVSSYEVLETEVKLKRKS